MTEGCERDVGDVREMWERDVREIYERDAMRRCERDVREM